MRTLGTAVAALVFLSCSVMADEQVAVSSQSPTSPVGKPAPDTYEIEWQRRLLAVQLDFVATLPSIDPVKTGAITPRTR